MLTTQNIAFLTAPETDEEAGNKRSREGQVERQQLEQILPEALQRIRPQKRIDALLNPQPVDLDKPVVGEQLDSDKKESERYRGDLADFFKRVARSKPGEQTEGELTEYRGERFDIREL